MAARFVLDPIPGSDSEAGNSSTPYATDRPAYEEVNYCGYLINCATGASGSFSVSLTSNSFLVWIGAGERLSI